MKKIFYIFLLISPLLFISSCEEEVESSDIQIGASYQGGIIFYIDETGEHGLVVSQSDIEESYQWGCYSFNSEEMVGASATEIGEGLLNTINIVNNNCLLTSTFHDYINGEFVTTYTDYEGPVAAGAAYGYESQGYVDWYLPSKDELTEIFNTLGNLWSQCIIENGNIYNSIYWSSSEVEPYSAWAVAYCNGLPNDIMVEEEDKDNTYRVLPIRSF
jgi:hypothetical protein